MNLLDNFTEDKLEEAAIEIFEEMGYEHAYGPDISVDGEYPERANYKDCILEGRIKDALFKINRDIPQDGLDDAFRQIITFNSPSIIENNKDFHKLLTEGIDVQIVRNGEIKTEKVRICVNKV